MAVSVVWTMLHGAVTSWYPYAIIDVTKLGYPAVLRTSVVLLAFIVAVALTYV